MQVHNVRIMFSWLLLLYACSVTAEAKPTTSRVGKNATNASSSSAWLLKVVSKGGDPRPIGCWSRPWICNRGETPPFRMRCCRNRCVDITSDIDHCGLCAIRCPYTWKCCFGLCRNININPLHCGRCFNRCPFGVPCLFGMCGYARPLPPRRPFPFPPRPPRPRPWPQPPKGDDPRKPPKGDDPRKPPSKGDDPRKPPKGYDPRKPPKGYQPPAVA
ncbi:stigma-specific STIG1-like protein 4 [Eucalyptus grandis]|uniref:stigma-specific STIG1-like protein 4 n=1 Tax=Eucalyptus grandis TaxID=71139 RepID=UPI00192EDAB9|nr:stigma-specific STIG1-like protein 4 [Eucalyptus grandis]